MKPIFTIFTPAHNYGLHGGAKPSDNVTKQEMLRLFARELQRDESDFDDPDPGTWERLRAGVFGQRLH